jgi:hypothetical protein
MTFGAASLPWWRAHVRVWLLLALLTLPVLLLFAPPAEAGRSGLGDELTGTFQEGGATDGTKDDDKTGGNSGTKDGDKTGTTSGTGQSSNKTDGSPRDGGSGGTARGGDEEDDGEKKGDRGRPVDRDKSLLDDVIERLVTADAKLADFVASGTIGDVYRELRDKGEAAKVAKAIRDEVKGTAVVEETGKETGKTRKVVRVESAARDVTATVPVEALNVA